MPDRPARTRAPVRSVPRWRRTPRQTRRAPGHPRRWPMSARPCSSRRRGTRSRRTRPRRLGRAMPVSAVAPRDAARTRGGARCSPRWARSARSARARRSPSPTSCTRCPARERPRARPRGRLPESKEKPKVSAGGIVTRARLVSPPRQRRTRRSRLPSVLASRACSRRTPTRSPGATRAREETRFRRR